MLPWSPQDHAAFSTGWQKMDLLIIVPVHANERVADESITPGEECAVHTNDTVKPGYTPRRRKWEAGGGGAFFWLYKLLDCC